MAKCASRCRRGSCCLLLVWAGAIAGCARPADTADSLQKRGIAFKDAGKYDSALDAFSRAIQEKPSDPGLLNSRAMAYVMLDNYDLAIADFDRALALDTAYALAVKNRARVNFYLGRYQQSAADFRRGAALDPGNLYVSIWLYLALQRLDGTGASELASGIARADSLWPLPIANYLRGTLSEAQLDSVVKITDTGGTRPNECHSFYVAERAFMNGDLAQARERYERTIQHCDPTVTEPHASRAQLDRMAPAPSGTAETRRN